MNIPKLTNIVDEIALESAVSLILLDNAFLANVPILPEIKGLIENSQMADVLWTLPRSAFTLSDTGWKINKDAAAGLVGGGILIEIPEMNTDSPSVSGPPATWKIGIVGMVEVNTALVAGTGIGMTSSQLCQIALDQLHLQNIFGFGTLKAERGAITAAHDWMQMKPGITAHRVTLSATIGRTQTKRSAAVSAVFGSSQCTLSCTDGSAAIYYVLNGVPGSVPVAANPAAILYAGPFNVNSGDKVLAASKSSVTILSEIFGYTAP